MTIHRLSAILLADGAHALVLLGSVSRYSPFCFFSLAAAAASLAAFFLAQSGLPLFFLSRKRSFLRGSSASAALRLSCSLRFSFLASGFFLPVTLAVLCWGLLVPWAGLSPCLKGWMRCSG